MGIRKFNLSILLTLALSACSTDTPDNTFGNLNTTFTDGNERPPSGGELVDDDTGGGVPAPTPTPTPSPTATPSGGGSSGGGNGGAGGPLYSCKKNQHNKEIVQHIVKAEVPLLRIELNGEVLAEPNKTIDLMNLEEELNAALDAATFPTGVYDHLQLIVGDGTVTLDDGRVFDLKVPSGAQSGIKIQFSPLIIVLVDGQAQFKLEFNIACHFVVRGNPTKDGFNGFIFKPVIHLEKK